MKTLLLFALLALAHALGQEKPEQKLPEPIELPAHVQTLITNHINHVLEEKSHGQTATLTGHVPQAGLAGKVAVPHLDLLPPHVEEPKVPQTPQVINHEAAVTSVLHPVPHKVVMPPVPHIVLTVPGHAPLDIGDKVNQLQHHVGYVMQQAQSHIPQVINQAIKEHEKLQAQKQKEQEKEKKQKEQQQSSTESSNQQIAARLLLGEQQVPQMLAKHRQLQNLGKCNFKCPSKALPVCATNGDCVVEFAGQCELSEWNCFNTKNVFRQVHDDECRKTIRCYERDMM